MNANNAVIYYEAGQELVPAAALTDTGDHKTFAAADELISRKAGCAPVVRPNGLATGGNVSPAANAGVDTVDVAALTCFLGGALVSVANGADTSVTRGAAANTHIINSITITAAGAIAVVAGTASTSHSETRGAAGGPPWIPPASIEIAQVRLTSVTAAAVTAAEIFMVPGAHLERYDYPVWDVVVARVENGVPGYAGVDFASALPAIHSADAGTSVAGKKVFMTYSTPIFAEISDTSDFSAPETSHSVSSTQIYGKIRASSSESLGQGGFTAYLTDGISDGLVREKNSNLWFKFKPDRLGAACILCQGRLGIARTFPAGDGISAKCTISADAPALEIMG